MANKLISGLNAAIGSRYLKTKNQLVFVEYSAGKISALDLISSGGTIVSQGAAVLKGTWIFDCETGAQGGNTSGPGDIWWEQIDPVKRQITPVGGASIVNLGSVNYAALTPQALQALNYGKTPILANNDATNQLVNGDVFAVQTKDGNFAKILVVNYGYNMNIQWVTYKLPTPYHTLGTGYQTPEDIAVASDQNTAYITERTGNLLKASLSNANRANAVVVASGMIAPQQIFLDDTHKQAYVVEYANPGKLYRIDLTTLQKTVLISGLNNAVGLLISSDLAYAYISEQSGGGKITRYPLQGGVPVVIASGLTNPFFLSWLDSAQTTIVVPERDPANRITLVNTVPSPTSIRHLPDTVGARPSSATPVDDDYMLVCCEIEIDELNVLDAFKPTGVFMGIGYVPWNYITSAGRADTTVEPKYPYQFAKDSPFGGTLSLQINHMLGWQNGIRFYRIKVDNIPRLDTWWDLKLNMANGKYEIPVEFAPKILAGQPGFYDIRQPGEYYMNATLGMILNSVSLANGLHTFKIELANASGTIVNTQTLVVYIDNNKCVASIQMPIVANNTNANSCGMLNFANKTDPVQIVYIASHPILLANYSFAIIRGSSGGIYSAAGPAQFSPITYSSSVGPLLGPCPTAAAFAAQLYVATTVINGVSRQSQYDASATVAFALTP